MVDQGGDPEGPHAEWHLRIAVIEEGEGGGEAEGPEEPEKESGLFFKI